MPAADSGLSLTEYEKAVLVRWVEQGADWKPHWSLIPAAAARRAVGQAGGLATR